MDSSQSSRSIQASGISPVRILIANGKGGSGKTTIATNLASHLVKDNRVTSLIDYDPQGSSSEWLALREAHLPEIHGVAAFNNPPGTLKSWHFKNSPLGTERVIIDSAAGLAGHDLSDMISLADIILVPVMPSAIDTRAAINFIEKIHKHFLYRRNPKPIGVIANRVKKNAISYSKLCDAVKGMDVPIVATLRDTQYYVQSSESGKGVVDLKSTHKKEKEDWHNLLGWIENVIAELP